MGRKSFIRKREILPDPKFNDLVVAKFVNSLLRRGKKLILYRFLKLFGPSGTARAHVLKIIIQKLKTNIAVEKKFALQLRH